MEQKQEVLILVAHQFFSGLLSRWWYQLMFVQVLLRNNSPPGSRHSCSVSSPGVVHTELCRSLSLWQQLLVFPVAKLFFLDPEAGSQTTLHCALQEGIEPLSGRYFSSCALQQVGARGRDDAVAKKLWEVSERLTEEAARTK